MNRLPDWIPNFASWMSAVFLLFLTGGLALGVRLTWQMAASVGQLSPRLGIFLAMVGLLLPISLIAIAHHLLHLFLDRFFPDSRSSELGTAKGFFPGLMSWWEGLYGWMVLILSTLISAGILGFLFYSPSRFSLWMVDLFTLLYSWDKGTNLLTIPAIVWIVVAACLYQFEHVVRQHLIATGRH